MITGTVVEGKGLGRKLGFPTANIKCDVGSSDYDTGVYAAYAYVGNERYIAVVNIGRHPTFPSGTPTTEAHLIGYSGDLYGSKLILDKLTRLRGEQKFESAKELTAQIRSDMTEAQRLLGGTK